MSLSKNLYNVSLQLFDEVEAIRAVAVDYENHIASHGGNETLEGHLRNGRDSLRIAQVHFFQLSEAMKSQGADETVRCSADSCSIEPGLMETSLIWLSALTVIGMILSCAAQSLRELRAGSNRSRPPYSSSYRNEQNEEEGHWPLEPEDGPDMTTDHPQGRDGPPHGAKANLREQRDWSKRQSEKLDKLLSLFPVLLTHFTMLRNQQARQHEERAQELTVLKRETIKTKTDIALFKHRLEEAETNYYSVSLTARMLGVAGVNARERLLSRSMKRPEGVHNLSSMAEQILGNPTPPDWILASRMADNFLCSHFPGLGTRLSWEPQLPGIDPSGAERFRTNLQAPHRPRGQGRHKQEDRGTRQARTEDTIATLEPRQEKNGPLCEEGGAPHDQAELSKE